MYVRTYEHLLFINLAQMFNKNYSQKRTANKYGANIKQNYKSPIINPKKMYHQLLIRNLGRFHPFFLEFLKDTTVLLKALNPKIKLKFENTKRCFEKIRTAEINQL